MSRVSVGDNLLSVCAFYFVSKLYLINKFNLFLSAVFEIVVVALYYFAKEFIKTNKKRFLMCLFVAISCALELYFSFETVQSITYFLIGFLLKILFALYFDKLFAVCKTKSIFFKFGNFDYLIFSVMIFLLSMGLFSFYFIAEWLWLFVIAVCLVFACRVFSTDKFFVVISMVALGTSAVRGDSLCLVLGVLGGVILVNFKNLNKWIYGFLTLICFGVFVVIFKFYTFISYFSLIFAVFLYLITPNRVVLKLSALFEQDAFNLICDEIQKGKMNIIKQKLDLMSGTFRQMQNDFKFLVVGKINRQKASEELAEDVVLNVCKNCENFKQCFEQNINKKQLFQTLLFRAFENKSIGKNDLSNGLVAYCFKSGMIVSEINQIATQFLGYEKAMKNEDSSKLLISSELGNFSDIFSNFAKMLKYSLKINKKSSKMLKESFVNGMIDAKEVVVLENEFGIESVNIVASNEIFAKKELIEILNKNLKNKMMPKQLKHLNFSGLGLACFVPIGRFRVEFAVSSKSKETKNGDNVSVCKLSDTKYFLALADGMGHGESANQISTMVLSLIKNMFRVGLDDELIISSVNKLLLPAGLDNFTSLDVCVIDIESEMASFIKLGASVSVIKHQNTSEVVSCDSLPMGIVAAVKPTIIKKQISFGDVIVLASDGVVDGFGEIEAYKNFINDFKIYNLQKFADTLVFDSEFQNTKHPDDMTVIAINLLKN